MRALVIGASGGIGAALVAGLTRQGAEVLGLSRSIDGLDITDEASIATHLDQLSGPFDTVIVATGALALGDRAPEKSLRSLTGGGVNWRQCVGRVVFLPRGQSGLEPVDPHRRN